MDPLPMDNASQASEARLIVAGHAREVSDFARGIVGGTAGPADTADRIVAARRLRLLSLQVLQWTVRAEWLKGASWAEIAAALDRDEETVRAEFEVGTEQWAVRAGAEANAEGRSVAAAVALDEWYRAHAGLLDPAVNSPVSGLFTPPAE
ncbi:MULTISPECIES: hypothetical protein [unclassified Streptomyces]|uniref:hypothetical protein n=1 Tax=unclassified Streptomyces TaxID=2593676 RepID=UPI0035D96763